MHDYLDLRELLACGSLHGVGCDQQRLILHAFALFLVRSCCVVMLAAWLFAFSVPV